jgi:hypothetical protein
VYFFFVETAQQEQAGLYTERYLMDVYSSAIRRMTRNAVTSSCKARIEFEFMKHIRAIAEESAFPFEDILFTSLCPSNTEGKLVCSALISACKL